MGFESYNFGKQQPSQEQPRRPGGTLEGKPIQGPDGQWYDKFGEKISQDAAYAIGFWKKQPAGMREAMHDILKRAEQTGIMSSLASPDKGIEDDLELKQKLSAYRELAREMGYEVGQFQFDKRTGTATASIKKAETK